jgi:hypothetical protein
MTTPTEQRHAEASVTRTLQEAIGGWLYTTDAARERAERKAASAKRRAIRYRVRPDGTIEQRSGDTPEADGWAKTERKAIAAARGLLPPAHAPELPTIALPAPPRYKRARPRCGARTRKGTPCQAQGLGRGGRCKNHGGMSTGARTPEGRQRIHEAQHRRWRNYRAARDMGRFETEGGPTSRASWPDISVSAHTTMAFGNRPGHEGGASACQPSHGGR